MTTPFVTSSFSINGAFSTDGLSTDQFQIVFYNSKIILKSLKFYKYALSDYTILDLGVYKDTNDGSYSIADDFYQNYASHWEDNSTSISNSSNACLNSIGNDSPSVWANLETPGVQSCDTGYQLEGYFWVEVWGDGVITYDPIQTMQCDDGNNIDGDGCSANWTIENLYHCNILYGQGDM